MKGPESVCYFENIKCTRISYVVNFNPYPANGENMVSF